MEQNTNSESTNFYIMIEDNNNHTEREISLFDASKVSFFEVEKLAKSLFGYYEYQGYTGNPKGTTILKNWNEYVPITHRQSFDVATSSHPIQFPELVYDDRNFAKKNKSLLISKLSHAIPSLSQQDLQTSKLNSYQSLTEFFARNPINFRFNPIFATFPESEYINSDYISSRPIYDLFGKENYLVNVQGKTSNSGVKLNFGSTIITNKTEAKTLALALAQYYIVGGYDVGVILKRISSEQAIDLVFGKILNQNNVQYYSNLNDFLSNKNYPDFESLINENLHNLGYLEETELTENLSLNSKKYYEPTTRVTGHDKMTRLVSFNNEAEAEKYLKAYTKATESNLSQESKVNEIEIFGNPSGMDLHGMMIEDMSFDTALGYIEYVERSKRQIPLDTGKNTFEKIKQILKQSSFGE